MTVFDRFNLKVVATAGLCGAALALSPGCGGSPAENRRLCVRAEPGGRRRRAGSRRAPGGGRRGRRRSGGGRRTAPACRRAGTRRRAGARCKSGTRCRGVHESAPLTPMAGVPLVAPGPVPVVPAGAPLIALGPPVPPSLPSRPARRSRSAPPFRRRSGPGRRSRSRRRPGPGRAPVPVGAPSRRRPLPVGAPSRSAPRWWRRAGRCPVDRARAGAGRRSDWGAGARRPDHRHGRDRQAPRRARHPPAVRYPVNRCRPAPQAEAGPPERPTRSRRRLCADGIRCAATAALPACRRPGRAPPGPPRPAGGRKGHSTRRDFKSLHYEPLRAHSLGQSCTISLSGRRNLATSRTVNSARQVQRTVKEPAG